MLSRSFLEERLILYGTVSIPITSLWLLCNVLLLQFIHILVEKIIIMSQLSHTLLFLTVNTVLWFALLSTLYIAEPNYPAGSLFTNTKRLSNTIRHMYLSTSPRFICERCPQRLSLMPAKPQENCSMVPGVQETREEETRNGTEIEYRG